MAFDTDEGRRVIPNMKQFVQTLANPYYLHHLSTTKHLDDEAFVAYCKYLQYFSEPRYLQFLS